MCRTMDSLASLSPVALDVAICDREGERGLKVLSRPHLFEIIKSLSWSE